MHSPTRPTGSGAAARLPGNCSAGSTLCCSATRRGGRSAAGPRAGLVRRVPVDAGAGRPRAGGLDRGVRDRM